MNILHITDLHYNSNSYEKLNQEHIIDKLCKSLENLEIKIDLVFFTGDLVFSGKDVNDFEEAQAVFLNKISTALSISSENILMCPGNHDMDRSSKSEALEDFFKTKIKSDNELYDFIKKSSEDYQNSIKTTTNYNSFVRSYYNDNETNNINELYSIFTRKIENVKIGIIAVNSAWRSVDDESNGNLLFPNYLLDEALSKAKDCEWKFFLMHHPVHWFKEFCQLLLQKSVYKHCDVMFSGHIHESEVSTHYKQKNGICAIVSQASLSNDKFTLGFSIAEIDLSNHSKSIIHKYHYIEEAGDFNHIDSIEIVIPSGDKKIEQNTNREKINSKIIPELLIAKDLLLNNEIDDTNDYLFLELFNDPNLKLRPKENINENSQSLEDNFNFKQLLSNSENYLIYGHDKSGKTSLLKYLQIEHLKNYSRSGIIPFYIDFKDFTASGKTLNLIDEVRKYFGFNRETTKKIIASKNFRFLIDNFETNHENSNEIIQFLETNENINIVVSCDYLASKIFGEIKIDNRELIKLYLHDISRKEVRNYIQKSALLGNENIDKVLEKIVLFCKQIELPINYWTISLILMVHKKTKFDITKNIFNLLDSCVDEILEKKHKALSKSKISFKQIKTMCGNIAEFLLTDNSKNTYSKKYSEILIFLEEQLTRDFRIKADAQEILEYLISSGVLKYREENEMISFRLNGIFEYFISFYMSKNSTFRDKLLDDKIYLSFKNEFEIYSGIINDDDKFLKLLFEKTKNYFSPRNEYYRSLGRPDLILLSKVTDKNDVNLKKIVKSLNTVAPLSSNEKDELRDELQVNTINSDIVVKKVYDVKTLTPEIYERYISILARVFKTMEGVNSYDLLSDITDFLLETYINFGFYLFETVEEHNKEENFEKDSEEENSAKNIMSLLGKILPFITQVNMTDSIAQYNIEKLVIDKIEELKKDHKNNQYKLFVLYFLLMDIDEENIIKYTDEVLEFLDMGILKYCSIIKLRYYFDFNGAGNRKLTDFLKNKIEVAKLRLDNKIDKGSVQSSLDKQKNRFGLNRRKY